jgi:hypothetical protein
MKLQLRTITLGLLAVITLGLTSCSADDSEDVGRAVLEERARETSASPSTSTAVTHPRPPLTTTTEPPTTTTTENPELTNARRSARSYLELKGFSRLGLIDQLSSEYGERYPLDVATTAVDSLDVDWLEEAEEAARDYLELRPFSRAGLVEQLSSAYGDRFTPEEAEHGADAALGG